jgi:hypothetical protein
MLQIKGIYEDGHITLLEDAPVKRKTPVLINFIIEEKEVIDYSPLDEMFGFCESERTDASINHDKIIYELEN